MRIRVLAAVALAGAAAFSTATPASAACVGTARTVVVCASVNGGALPTVDPTGGEPYEDCVYVGSKCIAVVVPTPDVQPGSGQVLNLSCGGDIGIYLLNCESPV